MGIEYNYKLEKHLKNLCEENKEFEILWSTWNLNKNSCKQILKTVILNYPNFSMHDDSHSESVIKNIELILGKERVQLLSPTDTWLLLNSAYFHDFGMALLYDILERDWGSEKFNNFLEASSFHSDKGLIHAIDYINNLKENLNNKDFDKRWPLKIRKNVNFIISSYFRTEHSSLSKEYINSAKKQWDLDMSHNGLINERFIKLIGDISMSHTQDANEILNLEYQSNGYNADYIHPRFISELLRLGDLLDTDSDRFNKYLEFTEGTMPESSEVHKNKHKSITHILITPEVINYSSDSLDTKTNNTVKAWDKCLTEELDFFALNWNDIAPQNMTGSAPRLKGKKMMVKNKVDKYGFTDMKFQISQKKAFDIIRGSDIYSDKYVFLREVLQNSLDAIKIQLWRDLTNEIYNSWNHNKNYDYPFKIDKEIYNNYYIKIYIDKIENDYINMVIVDNGTGISIDSLKNMCNVGSSYSERELWNEINKMPKWLRPTGGFGIGLQSIFLITDSFKIQTRSNDTPLQINVEKLNDESFFEITEFTEKMNRGTKIILKIKSNLNFRLMLGGKANNYYESYDPFEDENDAFIYKLLDEIQKHYYDMNIPLKVYYKDKENPIYEIVNGKTSLEKYIKLDYLDDNDKYSYFMQEDDDFTINVWDKQELVYFKFRIIKGHGASPRIYYKGMYVRNGLNYYKDGLYCYIDIYGWEIKDCLKLNRESLTENAKEKLFKVLEEALIFSLKKTRERLENTNNCIDGVLLKSFILLYNDMIDRFHNLDNKILNRIDTNLMILTLDDGKYKINKKTINLDNLWDYYYFNEKDLQKEQDLEKYEEYYNENIFIKNEEKIIIDDFWIKILASYFPENVKCVNVNKKSFLVKTMRNIDIAENNNWLLECDDDTKDIIIKSLKFNFNISRSLIRWQRHTIPAFSEYKELIVDNSNKDEILEALQYSFFYFSNIGVARVISPFKFDDVIGIEKMSCEDFIAKIKNKESFEKLVEYVQKNNIDNKITKEKIIDKYTKLICKFHELTTKENNLE